MRSLWFCTVVLKPGVFLLSRVMIDRKLRHPGFALVSLVMSLLVFSTLLSMALIWSSLGLNLSARSAQSGSIAMSLADGCAEAVLYEIQLDSEYDSAAVSLPTGECSVEIERSGDDYVITTEATLDEHIRRVRVELTRGANQLVVGSWLVE